MSVHILFNKVFKYIFQGKSIFVSLCFWGVTCDILQPELPFFVIKTKLSTFYPDINNNTRVLFSRIPYFETFSSL